MVVFKTPGEIDLMDEANQIVHEVLNGIAERVAPGVTTGELDRWAEATIREARRRTGVSQLSGISGDVVHGFERRHRARHPG